MRLPILATGLFVAGALMSLNPSPAITHEKLQAPAQDPLQLNGLVLGDSTEVEDTEATNANEQQTNAGEVKKDAKEQSKPTELIVTVKKGDTLSKIAKAHGTTYKRIFDANTSINNPDIINIGMQLRIPEASEKLVSRELPKVAPAPANASIRTYTRSYSKPVATNAPAVASGSVWDRLAACESGGNWQINTGNGYYGGLQFLPSTWRAVGGTGLPHQHSREEQIKRAEILLARSGWGQWPQCARKIGML